jgi:hypothetical protein
MIPAIYAHGSGTGFLAEGDLDRAISGFQRSYAILTDALTGANPESSSVGPSPIG